MSTEFMEVHTQYKIRLSGIDAPEKHQAFGNASKKSLSDLVYNKEVVVVWNKRDQYKRILGKVLLDNVDMNLAQIKRGMAWFYEKYKKELIIKDQSEYLQAQEVAQDNLLGLWVDIASIPPWEFRRLNEN